MKIVLRIPFLLFNNADIKFAEVKKLIWRSYNMAKALPNTSRVEFMNKNGFTKATLNENSEMFVVYVATLKIPTAMLIYLSKAFQVQRTNKSTLVTF